MTNTEIRKKDRQILRKEKNRKASVAKLEQLLMNICQKNCDTIQSPQFVLRPQARQAARSLHSIFEVLPNELTEYPDRLPTSFVDVETEIARCIDKLLIDVPKQRRGIRKIARLLREYKVVRLVREGNHSVSLHSLYVIFQDNYLDSYLCKLFNIMLAGFMNVQTKVMDF